MRAAQALPDCRVVCWEPGEAPAAAARRRLAHWRAARSKETPLAGDVNYAHLPCARTYLESGEDVRARSDRARKSQLFAD